MLLKSCPRSIFLKFRICLRRLHFTLLTYVFISSLIMFIQHYQPIKEYLWIVNKKVVKSSYNNYGLKAWKIVKFVRFSQLRQWNPQGLCSWHYQGAHSAPPNYSCNDNHSYCSPKPSLQKSPCFPKDSISTSRRWVHNWEIRTNCENNICHLPRLVNTLQRNMPQVLQLLNHEVSSRKLSKNPLELSQ